MLGNSTWFFSLNFASPILCLFLLPDTPLSVLASLFKILAGRVNFATPHTPSKSTRVSNPEMVKNFEGYSNYFDWWSNSGEKKHVPTLGKNSLKKHVTKNPRLKTRALRLGMVQWSMALPEQNSRGPRVHMHHFPDVVVVVKGHEYTLL